MKKKAILTGIVFLSLSVGTTVLASNGVTLKMNNIEVLAPTESRVENGQLLVPIRWAAEQLGAVVRWNEQNNQVEIQVPEQKNLKAQIDSLSNAVVSTDPKEAVNTWVTGVKKRSGSLQYAIMSPDLQKASYDEFSKNFWVTGVSSPKMTNEQLQEKKVTDEKINYTLTYDLKDSSGIVGKSNRTIIVEKDRASLWWVTSITTTDKSDIITPGVKQLTFEPFSDQQAIDLAAQAQHYFWNVTSGGSLDATSSATSAAVEDFPIERKGQHYRWMENSLNTRDKYLSYLEEVYTEEKTEQFWNEQVQSGSIVDVNGRLAQPNADGGSLAEWNKAKVKLIDNQDQQKSYEFQVPIGETRNIEKHVITFRYIEATGWRIDQDVKEIR